MVVPICISPAVYKNACRSTSLPKFDIVRFVFGFLLVGCLVFIECVLKGRVRAWGGEAVLVVWLVVFFFKHSVGILLWF